MACVERVKIEVEMTDKELEKKAKESYWDSEASGAMSSKDCYVVGYVAGAKAMIEKMNEMIEKMGVEE